MGTTIIVWRNCDIYTMKKIEMNKPIRNPIPEDTTFLSVIIIMTERNPGANETIRQLLSYTGNHETTKSLLLKLDDMNIRGSMLYLAYNDHCLRNVKSLEACILDPKLRYEMVITVNQEVSRGACDLWVACLEGAGKLTNDQRPSLPDNYFDRPEFTKENT